MFNTMLDIHKVRMDVFDAMLDTNKVCKGGMFKAMLDTHKVCKGGMFKAMLDTRKVCKGGEV